MNRRYFMTVLSGGLVAPQVLNADHHVISADPLEVEFDLSSLQGQYTPVEDFYVRNHFAAPDAVASATLTIEGEVEERRVLGLADLASLPEREIGAMLECAGDRIGPTGLVSNGHWAGWPLKGVLGLARPTAKAAHVHLFGRDGYKRSVPLERALADGVLVTGMNSRPLGRQHGAPWRVLLPGWYGMDSVKWLGRIVAARDPLPPEGGTYQESRQTASGEVERQPLPRIQVKSVIVDPRERTVLRRGKVVIRGLAWTGSGRVDSVEVSADAGNTWRAATLGLGSDLEWVVWKAFAELTQPGAVDFVVRARDAQGQVQPAVRDPARLDGYTNNWYHRVRCVVI